ncbi:unnamed protein product [Linum trigynum]|uniref:F-box domain-containing protein n=1 Tax=Linum trigynum TaxID=586398 RepID=A0AAV2CUD0_9ROSI
MTMEGVEAHAKRCPCSSSKPKTTQSHRRLVVPEELTTQVLLRLPSASSIHRFRWVCKLWRRLLFDPDFICQILFDETSHHRNDKARILVMRKDDDRPYTSFSSQTRSNQSSLTLHRPRPNPLPQS